MLASGGSGASLGSNPTVPFPLLCDLGQAAGPLCASASSPVRQILRWLEGWTWIRTGTALKTLPGT